MVKVNPKEVVFYDVSDNVLVVANNKLVPFMWCNQDAELSYITLYDIQKQLEDSHSCFMVIMENPLKGSVYRFNNYGEKEWYKVGSMCGYA